MPSGYVVTNGPWRVPSARAQNNVGSGAGATITCVPASHDSFGGSGASGAGASGGGSACMTTLRVVGGSVGAARGEVASEPHAEPNVKTKGNVYQRCTSSL